MVLHVQQKPGGRRLVLGRVLPTRVPNEPRKDVQRHGTCSVFNDGEGVEKVGCQCDDGFFGTGCELTCPGSLDGGGDTSNPDTVCGGHGVCDVEEKFRTGEPPVSVCCLHKTRSVLPTAFTLSVGERSTNIRNPARFVHVFCACFTSCTHCV